MPYFLWANFYLLTTSNKSLHISTNQATKVLLQKWSQLPHRMGEGLWIQKSDRAAILKTKVNSWTCFRAIQYCHANRKKTKTAKGTITINFFLTFQGLPRTLLRSLTHFFKPQFYFTTKNMTFVQTRHALCTCS